MTIQWCEGFDLTTSSTMHGWSLGAQASISASGGRISGGRLLAVTSAVNQNATATKQLYTPRSNLGICTGWHSNGPVTQAGIMPTAQTMRFIEGSTYHITLHWGGHQSPILAYRGGSSSSSGTLIGTGTTDLLDGTWYHLEVYVEIADASGRVKVFLDGNPTPEIDFTGDTQNGGTGVLDRVSFGHITGNGGGNVTTGYDDLVVYDDTGGINDTEPLGDLRVLTLMPNGNGTTSNGVGNDGNSTDNYLLVDEATMNSDTDYVDFSAIGDKDTYAMTNAGVTGSVLAVQNRAAVRKTDAGTRSAKPVLRLSGTEVDGDEVFLNLSYRYITQVHNTKPGGGSWSISDVDSTEAGVKMTA